MNFDFSADEQALAEKISQVMQAPEYADEAVASYDLLQSRETLLAMLARLSEAGYAAPDLSPAADMSAMIEVARFAPSLFLALEMSRRVYGSLIREYGTEDRKNELLGPLEAGEIVGAVALSEETMSAENNPPETEGVVNGDHLLLSGTKNYVINAVIADSIAVIGRLDGKPAVFLTDAYSEGTETGERLSTMGCRGVYIHRLMLNECPLALGRVFGPFEDDRVIQDLKRWENLVLTAGAVGMMQRSFDEAKAYAQTHKSGGKPVIAYQEVSFKLSEMLTLLQTSRLMACKAAWSCGTGDKEADTVMHCAKVFCTESAETVAGSAMRILSAQGFLSGSAAETAYRDAKYSQIAGTSTEIARVKIGDAMMKSGK